MHVDIVNDRRYFGSFWNWIRLLSLAIVYSAIGVYAWRSVLTVEAVEEVLNNRGSCHLGVISVELLFEHQTLRSNRCCYFTSGCMSYCDAV